MLSFETAYKMKADMIELDVRATSDGQLVCIHDSDVSKVSETGGLVAKMTLEEIRRLDVGKGQRIPLLTEALDFARGRIGVDIEIKVKGIEDVLFRIVSERNMICSVLFSSFLHSTLRNLKAMSSEVGTAILYDEYMDDPVKYALDFGANAINPLAFLLTPEHANLAHESGLLIFPWTVNDARIMNELLSLGVDGIITDYPDIGRKIVSSYLASA